MTTAIKGKAFLFRSGAVLTIDAEDYFRCLKDKIYLVIKKMGKTRRVHACKYTETIARRPRYKYWHLGRLLLNPQNGMVVDHIDGDPLNNSRSNLRVCTTGQNLANKRKSSRNGGGTSKYKGVFRSSRNLWGAQVVKSRKVAFRKYFDSELDAAKYYDEMAKIVHGEFFKGNFS